MKLIFGHDEFIANAVGQALGVSIHPPYTAIGFADASEVIRGGAVFNNYNGSNIELTMFAPRAVTKGLIRAIVHYVFVQLECNRLSARTKRSNKPAQVMLPKIGFKWEANLKAYYGKEKSNDAVLFCLDRKTALSKWSNDDR